MANGTLQTWAQKIGGPLIVAMIISFFTGALMLWSEVNKLVLEVDYLKAEAELGGRFTEKQGQWMDLRILSLEAAHDVHQKELDVHKLLQEHIGAARQFLLYNKRMDALEDRMDE